MKWISFHRCQITGRFWINVNRGWFAVGFGPVAFVERIFFHRRLVYYDYPAYLEGVRQRNMYK